MIKRKDSIEEEFHEPLSLLISDFLVERKKIYVPENAREDPVQKISFLTYLDEFMSKDFPKHIRKLYSALSISLPDDTLLSTSSPDDPFFQEVTSEAFHQFIKIYLDEAQTHAYLFDDAVFESLYNLFQRYRSGSFIILRLSFF